MATPISLTNTATRMTPRGISADEARELRTAAGNAANFQAVVDDFAPHFTPTGWKAAQTLIAKDLDLFSSPRDTYEAKVRLRLADQVTGAFARPLPETERAELAALPPELAQRYKPLIETFGEDAVLAVWKLNIDGQAAWVVDTDADPYDLVGGGFYREAYAYDLRLILP